ncbi:predicted protein [Paecilomyces variotii No. 5]|uniref:Uncharacterized protein n=1 Tax=Byssochlamys spectabilis (strain No. 5 / NBRC 109023) TaxID=1356009 RepID=V5F7C7_BYSSN|nr:predicted protein [Paecilomyces variotii No. 5]
MVGLRKLFSPDNGVSLRRPRTRHHEDSTASLNQLSCAENHAQSTVCSPMSSNFPPELKSPRLDMSHHFAGIERQFEELHEQFQSRPMSAVSHCPSDTRSAFTTRTTRHIDLVEAVSSNRYQMNGKSLTDPYNENIADRNILHTGKKKQKRSRYARIISALYQEDVADRNTASRGSSVSNSGSRKSGNSSEAEQTTRSGFLGRGRVSHIPTILRRQNSGTLVTSSQVELPQVPSSVNENPVSYEKGARQSPAENLRSQKSAPNLLSNTQNTSRNVSRPGESNLLEVPGAFKYGRKMSSVPLPDSPTLPDLQCQRPATSWVSTDPVVSNEKCDPERMGLADASRAASKKNVRDLRINTQLASTRGPVKIEHRAIQPPTPHQDLGAPSPSIAQIVNSPLPAATPSSISSPPPSTYNAEEIMNMFKHAYVSTHAESTVPTFETLQDAIVREINSHEAFRRVPVPDIMAPPFTPPLTEDEFLTDSELQTPVAPQRQHLEKESQFTKLIRKTSQGRKRRSKSISSLIQSYDKLVKRPETSGRGRRHTFAERPSAGLAATMYPDQNFQGQAQRGPVPYGNLHRGASDSEVPLNKLSLRMTSESGMKGPISTPRSGSRKRANTLQSRPSVIRHMCAQASPPEDDNDKTFYVDDDPDDIIELPHVDVRPVQIKSVDDNDVAYFYNAVQPIHLDGQQTSKRRTTPQGAHQNHYIPSPFPQKKKHIPLRRSSLNSGSSDFQLAAQ